MTRELYLLACAALLVLFGYWKHHRHGHITDTATVHQIVLRCRDGKEATL